MPDLVATLPREVELGAVRRLDYATDIVTTDGGHEVRNGRWAQPLRTWDLSFPTSTRDDAVYLAVVQLFALARGSLYTFAFTDWTDETGGTVVTVRFDSSLSITGVDIALDHIDSLTIKEVRE